MHTLFPGIHRANYNKEIAISVLQVRRLRFREARLPAMVTKLTSCGDRIGIWPRSLSTGREGMELGRGPHCGRVEKTAIQAGKEPGRMSRGERTLSLLGFL